MFWASPGPFGAFEKWASANPEAQVFLWYDSAQTTSHVVEASNAVLKEQLATHKIGNLHLRDVREITIVRSNPDCFSDQIPVYFRIDVLKAIIIVHSIEREGMDSAIFSDLEVGDRRPDHSRMGKAELFNAQFMRLLQRQGLLLNTNTNGIENQFLQLVKNARMIAAIKIAIVNVNLLRATTGLNAHDDAFIVGLARAPYRSMLEDVFAYYYGTEPGLHILVDPRIVRRGQAGDPWIEFQPTVQGYEPFGLVLQLP